MFLMVALNLWKISSLKGNTVSILNNMDIPGYSESFGMYYYLNQVLLHDLKLN